MVASYILDDATMFADLCSDEEFLNLKYMVHCVVRRRKVDNRGSRVISFMVAFFNVLNYIQQLTWT